MASAVCAERIPADAIGGFLGDQANGLAGPIRLASHDKSVAPMPLHAFGVVGDERTRQIFVPLAPQHSHHIFEHQGCHSASLRLLRDKNPVQMRHLLPARFRHAEPPTELNQCHDRTAAQFEILNAYQAAEI